MSNNTTKIAQTNNKQDGSFSMQMDNTTYVIGLHFSKDQQGNAGGQGEAAYPARCEGRQFLKLKIFAGVPFFYLDKTHPNR